MQVTAVGLKKYSKVSPTAFGLGGSNKIAVVRTSGMTLDFCALHDTSHCEIRSGNSVQTNSNTWNDEESG